jgi:hypothetical protein
MLASVAMSFESPAFNPGKIIVQEPFVEPIHNSNGDRVFWAATVSMRRVKKPQSIRRLQSG